MIINQMRLHNFRCFEDLTIEFNAPVSVIVGVNGAGKSTVLDGLAVAIGTLLRGFDSKDPYGIAKSDAMIKCFDMGSVIDAQPQYPVCVWAQGTVDGREVAWERTLQGREGRTTIVDAKDMLRISEEYQQRVRQGDKSVILPLISYYGTGRLWAQKREKKNSADLQKFSRMSGYIDCLAAASNEKMMLKWFEKMTIQQAQRSGPIAEFEVVKHALSRCFESDGQSRHSTFQFNLDTHEIDVLYAADGSETPNQRASMNSLSDGYKNTLSMIADIAYRMALLNPQLQEMVLQQTPGVVLIDEVDLHLHPKWQQRILRDLTTIFPKIQFIVTTHAPAVVNAVDSGSLLLLDGQRVYYPRNQTFGRDANSILREVMGTPERPEEIQRMFSAFHQLLTDERLVEAEKKLDEIEARIGPNDPDVTAARVALALEKL